MDTQSNITFAEIYQLDERKFAGETVKALSLSPPAPSSGNKSFHAACGR